MEKRLIALLFLASACFGQIVRVDPNPVTMTVGQVPIGAKAPLLAVPGASILVCANATCATAATTYLDSTGSTPCPAGTPLTLASQKLPSCVARADQQGNFGFWIASGNYYYRITLPDGTVYAAYPFTAGASSSGSQPSVVSSGFNWSQQPGGTLTGGVAATVSLLPCPLGVSGLNVGQYVNLFNGAGTPEAVPIIGGSCRSGQLFGTLQIAPLNSHSGAWRIGSASVGSQEAVNFTPGGATVQFPAGNFTWQGCVFYTPNHWFVGQSRTATVINETNTGCYAFTYHSPVLTVQNVIDFSSRFEEFTLNAKYGIQANSDQSGSMQFQALLVGGPYVNHVLFNGKYGTTLIDPNALTLTPANNTDLVPYGVAIQANKVFEMHVELSEFNSNGLAIRCIGCDIPKIDHNRYNVNGRNVQLEFYSDGLPDASGALGSSAKISDSDIIGVQRLGGISLTSSQFTDITNNFFEALPFAAGTTTVGEYIATSSDFGTKIRANRLDSMASANPAVSLDSRFGTLIEGNVANPNPPNPSFFCGTTHYDGANFPMLYTFTGNAPELMQCNSPLALIGTLNPYVFKYNNLPGQFFGTASATFPFIISPVTGRWVLKTTSPDFLFKMPLVRAADRNFVVKVTARRVTNTGFMTISLIESGNTTVLWSSAPNTGFSDTTNVQTFNFPITLPPAPNTALGYLQFDLANDQVEYDSIELIPQLNGAFPYQGSLGGGAIGVGTSIAVASTITPPGPYFYTTGTGTINNINIPAGFTGGSFCTIPVSVYNFTTAGNIGQAGTTSPNQVLCFILDPYGPKWFPTYTGGFSGTKTFGACTVSMSNGLVTAVSGC